MRSVRHLALLLALAFFAAPPRVAAQDSSSAMFSPASLPLLDQPNLFGTREIYSPDNSAFVKWNAMLERFRSQQQAAAAPCGPGVFDGCEPVEWHRLLDAATGLDLRRKLALINDAINDHPYIPSMRNWGESNHWETPFEFFRKSGQCQDYAIAKYLLLRAAGVPAGWLRIVVLRDARHGVDHAVTVAYVDGQVLMLDNQMGDLVPVDRVDHYQPYYSINEQGWWLHRGPNARYVAANGQSSVN
jgi:predicted transglutaminase-like cysteine proteinase